MRLSCPACGADMSLDVLLNVEAAREAVLAALMLPAPLGKLLLQYLTLFRPEKRQLSWERVATLFGDLALPLAEGKIHRHGRVWAAPIDYWRAALEEMLAKRDKLTLPLKSHGYLFEIVIGITEKAEKAAESLREQTRRNPHSQFRGEGEGSVAEVALRAIPEHARDRLMALGVLKKKTDEKGSGDGHQG